LLFTDYVFCDGENAWASERWLVTHWTRQLFTYCSVTVRAGGRDRDLVHTQDALKGCACRGRDRSQCRQQVTLNLSESKITVFWDITQYNPVENYQGFGWASCFHLEVCILVVSLLLSKSTNNWQSKHRTVWCGGYF
jgi:hypothetical protein